MKDLSEGTGMIKFDTKTYWIRICIETWIVVTPHTPRCTGKVGSLMTPSTNSPAAERTLRKRENTRARLIEVAADIVASKGIASTRIDDVVKQAGFTRGAFYSNYSSLQDILTEAIVMRSNTLLSQVTQAIDSFEGAPTMDSLMELLEAIRPEARTIYLLTTEYSLFQLRNPGSPTIPGTARADFTARLSGTVEKVLARMGRRPTVATASLADIVSLLFMDSIAENIDGTRLRDLIEAVIVGLSTPDAIDNS